MMHCKQAQARYIPFLCGELPAEDARRLAAHLDGCTACAGKVAVLRVAYRNMRDLPIPAPPVDLSEIANKAVAASSQQTPVILRYRRPLAFAAAAVVLLAFGLFASSWITPGRQDIAVRQQNINPSPVDRPPPHNCRPADPSRQPQPIRKPHHHPVIVRKPGHTMAKRLPAAEKERASTGTTRLTDCAVLLAAYLNNDRAETASAGEVRCGVLPLITGEKKAAASADTMTAVLQHELAGQLPHVKLTRVVDAEETALSPAEINAGDPAFSRLAAQAEATYLLVGRLSLRGEQPMLELYLINTTTRTFVFNGRHPMRLSPDELLHV